MSRCRMCRLPIRCTMRLSMRTSTTARGRSSIAAWCACCRPFRKQRARSSASPSDTERVPHVGGYVFAHLCLRPDHSRRRGDQLLRERYDVEGVVQIAAAMLGTTTAADSRSALAPGARAPEVGAGGVCEKDGGSAIDRLRVA